MYKIKNSFIIFCGQVLLIGIIALATAPTSYGQGGNQSPQNVNVVNTPNVSVTNTPTVNLSPSANTVQSQQSGAWNVGILGIPTVSITSGTNVGINGTPTFNLASGSSVGITGTPNVNILNTPTVGISPSLNTVNAQQSGVWNVGITGTPTFNLVSGTNVGITGTPTFGLSTSANTVKSEQSGAWNVGINGTPTVNLASRTTVGITGTPNVSLVPGTSVQINNSTANPIPVQNVGGSSSQTTLLLNSGTINIPNAPGTTDLGDFDASAFSKIRVVAKGNCTFLTSGNFSPNSLVFRIVVVEGNQPVQTIDEVYPCVITPTALSKIIDTPGTTLRITAFQEVTFNSQQSVQVVVYGR